MPYLRDCMNSILGQTHKDIEVIIVDDHSTDESLQVLRSYEKVDHRVSVLCNPSKGIISALRGALNHSKGKFITRMDADDVMATNKIGTLFRQLHQSGSGHVAVGQVTYFKEQGQLGDGYRKYAAWLNELSIQGDNFSEIYKECVIPSPCWMLYREDLMAIGAFDSEIYPEDYDLAFRMYEKGLRVIPASANILHHWRDHNLRSSRTDDHYSDNRFLQLKVDAFLRIDRNPSQHLILWGAGKKGKLIAKLLIGRNIDFHWITDNPKKIGVDIYGHQLVSSAILPKALASQLIVTIANPSEQFQITQYLSRLPLIKPFWFC